MLMGAGYFERWAEQAFEGEKRKLVRDFFTDHARLMHLENGYAVLAL